MHLAGCCLWGTSQQLLIAHIMSHGIALQQTESMVTLKFWKLSVRKFMGKSRREVGLAKVEVRSRREHDDQSPTILNINEVLKGPLVFMICAQGPSCNGDFAEKGATDCFYSFGIYPTSSFHPSVSFPTCLMAAPLYLIPHCSFI